MLHRVCALVAPRPPRPRGRAALRLTAGLGLALAGGAVPAACGSTPVHSNLNYAEQAQADYEHALAEMNRGNLTDAQEAFRRVHREHGLSHWGWLAELRIADIDFRLEHYTEAIQEYRAWIRFHANQPERAYAHYRIARCYYAQIPNDWALVPASWERDQGSTHDAEDQLVQFLADYSTSEYAPEARDFLRRTRELLARAEISVAEFYLARGRPDAAISRLREVVETYHGSGLEPEALVKIGETYLSMGRREDAREAFDTILTGYARSSLVESARRYIRFIGPPPHTAAPAATPDASASPSPTPAPDGNMPLMYSPTPLRPGATPAATPATTPPASPGPPPSTTPPATTAPPPPATPPATAPAAPTPGTTGH